MSDYLGRPCVITAVHISVRARQGSLNQKKRWSKESRGQSDGIAGFEERRGCEEWEKPLEVGILKERFCPRTSGRNVIQWTTCF